MDQAPERATKEISQTVYKFGPFRLDTSERLLFRDDQAVPLTPKAFETLLVLVRRSSHLATKDELLREIWPDSFVEESTLAKNIFTLRKALGSQADGADYIETVPKLGYRFVAAVEAGERNGLHAPAPAEAHPPRPRWRGWIWTVLVLVVAVALAGLVALRRWEAQEATGHRTMLAVLPFANYSGDPGEEYFTDGFTEEMITQLGALRPDRLGVIARTSAMHYKNTSESIAQIGHELGVDYVLEGSVRREGEQIRISAQLIQVSDQTHLWAANYERSSRDILAVQSDVAQQIAAHIRGLLGEAEQIRLSNTAPVSPEAYDAYLMGRFHWNKRNRSDLRESISFFQKAIAAQPDYARAYSGLADAYLLLGPYDGMPRDQAAADARRAAEKAVALNDSLAEGHASLGFLDLLYGWNPVAGEKELRRALALDFNYATAHHWLAYDLAAMGRFDEAIAEIREAETLDPLSANIAADAGQILYLARRFDLAGAEVQKALDLDPNFSTAHWYLGLLYQERQRGADAVEEFIRSTELHKLDAARLARIRSGFATGGLPGFWRAYLDWLDQDPPRKQAAPAFSLAEVAAQAGDTERAFAELQQAVNERYPSLVFLNVEPIFDPLRSDRRFADLLRKSGLPR
jgi:TolB-like protein/DNA-binding winged helix-turn-helix (wHTH) protein/Flp pilus assembly protein TadD